MNKIKRLIFIKETLRPGEISRRDSNALKRQKGIQIKYKCTTISKLQNRGKYKQYKVEQKYSNYQEITLNLRSINAPQNAHNNGENSYYDWKATEV